MLSVTKVSPHDKLLKLLDRKDIPKFSLKGYSTFAVVKKVYDGDTITIIFEYNEKIYRSSCRCLGYNCAELKSKDEQEKCKAVESKNHLSSLILNKVIWVEFDDFDKYGRPLITFYSEDKSICYNKYMVDHNLAKEYFGHGPKNY